MRAKGAPERGCRRRRHSDARKRPDRVKIPKALESRLRNRLSSKSLTLDGPTLAEPPSATNAPALCSGHLACRCMLTGLLDARPGHLLNTDVSTERMIGSAP